MGIQNPFTQASKNNRAFEAEAKRAIVQYLTRRTGQSERAVVQALNNPKYKDSWLGLYQVVKDKNCFRADYIDCACEGDPLNKCPHRSAYHDIVWDTDRETGALVGFRRVAKKCLKYEAAMQAAAGENITGKYNPKALKSDIDSMF